MLVGTDVRLGKWIVFISCSCSWVLIVGVTQDMWGIELETQRPRSDSLACSGFRTRTHDARNEEPVSVGSLGCSSAPDSDMGRVGVVRVEM